MRRCLVLALSCLAACGCSLLDEDGSDESEAELEPICAQPLAASVSVEALAADLDALDAIARAEGGNRSAGSSGYAASADYVQAELEAAGYTVERWDFAFDRFVELSPTQVELAGEAALEDGVDFALARWSPGGEVSAVIEAVDLSLGLGNESTSGCEAEDFAGFTPGRVALIQRGGCSFRLKAELAEAAGAVGTLIFNQGDEQARTQLHGGSLGSTNTLAAPVVMLPYARGEALAEAAAVQDTHATIIADTGVLDTPTFNLIAETPGGDPQAEVMLGAHLDSVPAGPGINDNGTGTALVLELARGMAGCSPRQKVRFAWWGGEEWGLKGSQAWVEALDEDALERIALYLNFDMVASPNYVRFVHDGSNGPEGSALIYAAFLDYFAAQGLATLPLAFEGNSDFQPFVDAGVPTGGLFTGAGGDKSVAEVEAFGGAGAAAYDSCYHQACDDRENVDLEVFAQNLAAAATVLEGLAGDLGELARDGALAEVGEGSALREGTVGVEVGAHEHAGCGHPLR